jgi:hypothetical protein
MEWKVRWIGALALVVGLSAASPAPAKSHGSHKHEGAHAETAVVGKYPTVTIRSGKVGEDRAAGVIYFDAAQREARRVTIRDGLVYDHTGTLLRETRSKHHNQNNYVMDASGNFYLFDEFTTPKIRHSSILAGGPVAGAGNIQISDGHVVYIDSDSGHYPSTHVFANVLAELAARGVDVGTITKAKK